MVDLNKLAQEIHEAAIAKGFWAVDEAMEKHIAKMHSELSEALQEDRCGHPMLYVDDITVSEPVTDINAFDGRKPEGVAAELADFVMMGLDFMCMIDCMNDCTEAIMNNYMEMEGPNKEIGAMSLPFMIMMAHISLSEVVTSGDNPADVIGLLLSNVILWAKQNGIDLEHVIRLKMEYNKNRPPLHGRKY